MSQLVVRRFGTLLSGTLVAQMLPVLTAPLIARNYDTGEFGVFGIFIAATAILATLGNLKYDTAILAASSQREVGIILSFCFVINIVIGVLIVAAAAFIYSRWLDLFGPPLVLVFLVPLSFVLSSGLQALSTVALQRELFTEVARSRMFGATTMAALSVIAALTYPTAAALVLASIGGQLAGIASFVRTKQFREATDLDFGRIKMVQVARRYWRFALFTSPADLLNAFASNLPSLFLGAIYGPAATGAYVLTQRIVGTPLMLIGSAFSDLYRQKIGRLATINEPYWTPTIRTIVPLLLLGMCALIFVVLFGYSLAVAFLGGQWIMVGEMVQILIFFYVVRFVASPITYMYYIKDRHSEDLALQLISVFCGALICFFAQYNSWSMLRYITFLSSYLSSIYILYGFRSMMMANEK
ncbi:MAG: oligosaccharide flippase family protein [Sphingomonadaceae bacterium]|jgi:O-antigen/teichoic acid export membrane protein